MTSENVKVEEAVETVTTVAEEAVKVAGPIIEQRSSKTAYVVAGGVLAATALAIGVSIRKRRAKKVAKNTVEAEEVMELLDTDIVDED